MSTPISETAVASREAHRDRDGKFGTQPAAESGTQVLTEPGTGTAGSRFLRSHQTLTLDPTTGASTPIRRGYSWCGEDESEGDFAVWSEDLGNTPYEHLSDQARADLDTITSELESGTTPAGLARTLCDSDEPDAELVASATALVQAYDRLAAGESPTDEQVALMRERAEHEAAGGVICTDPVLNETSWRSGPEDNAPLYRACADQGGAPARFIDGAPVAWVRGSQPVRAIYPDGSDVTFYPSGGVASLHRPDGCSEHYADDAPRDEFHGSRHRQDGPAVVSEEQVAWFRHDELHRDPDEGPAALSWDGEVTYAVDGVHVDPDPEQMARHGVEGFTAPGIDLALPGQLPSRTRYRMVGSDPDGQDIPAFDYAGTPVDPGAWPGRAPA